MREEHPGNDAEIFKRNLYRILREKHMTQQEFADRTGATHTAVWNWISGRNAPSYSTLLMIADVLDVSLDELCRNRKPAEPADEDALSEIAEDLMEASRQVMADAKKLNDDLKELRRQAKRMKEWSRRYYLIEDEEGL